MVLKGPIQPKVQTHLLDRAEFARAAPSWDAVDGICCMLRLLTAEMALRCRTLLIRRQVCSERDEQAATLLRVSAPSNPVEPAAANAAGLLIKRELHAGAA